MSLSIRKPFQYTQKNYALVIILITVVVYLLQNIFPMIRTYLYLNVYNCVIQKMFWQPFTYMFCHGNFQHILFNMLGLFFFGFSVEKAVGSKEFLLMYLLTGTLCGFFSLAFYFFTGRYGIFLMGASGAIYAMLLFYAVIFPCSKIYIWGILPVPAPILVIAYALIEFGSSLFGYSGNVAHMTHLAGFGFAWLYFLIRMGINPIRVWKDAYC